MYEEFLVKTDVELRRMQTSTLSRYFSLTSMGEKLTFLSLLFILALSIPSIAAKRYTVTEANAIEAVKIGARYIQTLFYIEGAIENHRRAQQLIILGNGTGIEDQQYLEQLEQSVKEEFLKTTDLQKTIEPLFDLSNDSLELQGMPTAA